jgi:hypothetical protein
LPPGFNLISPSGSKLSTTIDNEFKLEGEGDEKIYFFALYNNEDLEILSGSESIFTIAGNTLLNDESYIVKSYLETPTGYGYAEHVFETSKSVESSSAEIEVSPEDSDDGYHNNNMVITVNGFVDGEESQLTYQYFYDSGDGDVLMEQTTQQSITSPFPGTDSQGSILITVVASNVYLQSAQTSMDFDLGVIVVLQNYSSTVLVSDSISLDASESYKGKKLGFLNC